MKKVLATIIFGFASSFYAAELSLPVQEDSIDARAQEVCKQVHFVIEDDIYLNGQARLKQLLSRAIVPSRENVEELEVLRNGIANTYRIGYNLTRWDAQTRAVFNSKIDKQLKIFFSNHPELFPPSQFERFVATCKSLDQKKLIIGGGVVAASAVVAYRYLQNK